MALIFSFILFITPLVFFGSGAVRFEFPKAILSEILVIFLVIKIIFDKLIKIHFAKKLIIPLGIIFLISITNFIFSNKEYTFYGNPYRLQGTFFLWICLIISYISSLRIVKFSKLTTAFVFVALFIETILIGVNENLRFVGPFGEPNALSAFTLFLWPFVVFPSFKKKSSKNIYIAIVFVLTVILIFLSGSRSALIGLAVQAVFLFSAKFSKLKLSKAIIIPLAILLLSLILPFIETGIKYQDRALIWKTSLNSVWTSPLIGVGFGNAEYSITKSANALKNNIMYVYADSAHNIILNWLIESGFVGTSALVYLIFQTINNLIKTKNIAYLCSFLGILTCLFYNPMSVSVLIAFWFIIGSSFAEGQKALEGNNRRL